MLIREEHACDHTAVAEIHRLAFGAYGRVDHGRVVAALVDDLRRGDRP